ncbi:hypothetical protein P175DRAFT_0557252 [Aspergillus ochraceoroseus IBT 24754]|uniref:Uncharacterized protein n=1 Tax=Aspergillus ochraceoroseus IBT 24754 TaxID=1392256 RepID=A0A2T5LWB5_9EURO|nr:uncharacterized protein P175DRAFT_0557252 [Aspergillus ochraceoroseus IBT 24754]PTU20566.1 hypothetical protein P175DRAFT_0557252 [Aspergillus ochraceoroseus IBT 24754]
MDIIKICLGFSDNRGVALNVCFLVSLIVLVDIEAAQQVAGEAGKDEILSIFDLEEAAIPLRLKRWHFIPSRPR